MRLKIVSIGGLCLILQVIFTVSCKHQPLLDDEVTPIDTTENPTDTTWIGTPCDPNKVYFEKDILPLLKSNCAFSGCHDATSAEDDVVLESYQSVMATAGVKPFRPNDSKLYKVLIETDVEDRMPLDRPAFTASQKQLIANWIAQGAQDLKCDVNIGACDTVNVSYSQKIRPVLELNCKGCHSGNAPSGNIDLTTYANVRTVALNGKLYGAISWSNGFAKMPQGSSKLPDCTIRQFKAWIAAGAPEN